MKKSVAKTSTEGQQQYVAYYRVSTQKQGASGLGLEGQKAAVEGFVRGRIIGEFTEVESGKKDNRDQLQSAIDLAKREGATLVIAKLDRLSRNASFIFALRDSGVQFQCVDMPDANTLTVGIFATLAQHERELISGRTKAALATKRARGALLGSPANLTADAMSRGRAGNARKARNNVNNRRATSLVTMMHKTGKNYTQIAERLNEDGFRTARGCEFSATQVMRLLNRSKNLLNS